MQYEFVILIIFFVFIILPFAYKVEFEYNAIKNYGSLIIKLFFIPIYKQTIKINNGVVQLIKNKKIKKIKLSFKKDDIEKSNRNIQLVLNSQIVKNININTKIGIKGNPFLTSMIFGILSSFIGVFFSINTAKCNIINTQSKIKTSFKHTYFNLRLNMDIRCSIYQFLSLLLQFKMGVKVK